SVEDALYLLHSERPARMHFVEVHLFAAAIDFRCVLARIGECMEDKAVDALACVLRESARPDGAGRLAEKIDRLPAGLLLNERHSGLKIFHATFDSRIAVRPVG